MECNNTSVAQSPTKRSFPLELGSTAAALIVLLFPAVDPAHISLTGQKADRLAAVGESHRIQQDTIKGRRLLSSRPGRPPIRIV